MKKMLALLFCAALASCNGSEDGSISNVASSPTGGSSNFSDLGSDYPQVPSLQEADLSPEVNRSTVETSFTWNHAGAQNYRILIWANNGDLTTFETRDNRARIQNSELPDEFLFSIEAYDDLGNSIFSPQQSFGG